MAISDQQIFDWFLANPNADDATVAGAMDQFKLTPADIARATGSNVADVQARYDAYTTPTGGIADLIAAPADNITSTGGVTKSATAPTSGGVSSVIEGDDIDTQIAQLPEEYASWSRDGQYMVLIRKSDGAELDRRFSPEMSDVDLLKTGLSFVPGAGQILAAVNIADALRTGNLTGAAIGATGLIPGAANLNTALRVGQAVDSGNTLGALTALAGNTDLQKLTGFDTANVGGFTSKDAVAAANLASAATSGNVGGVITNLGTLAGSPDTTLAGKAITLITRLENGDTRALSDAISLSNSVSGNKATSTGTKVADAGDDVTLPGGVQLASLGDGVFRTDVGGVPTYAESANAGSVTVPFGYSLLSTAEADNKPDGSYYDPTANAWFKPDTDVTDLTGNANIQADIDLFNNSMGDLDQLAASTDTTSDDDVADFLASIGITNTTQLADSGLSNNDILDLVNAGTTTEDTITGGDGNDVEELVITGDKDKTGTTTEDTITGGDGNDLIVDDKGEVVIKDTKESCPVGTVLNPETGECDPVDETITCPPGKVLNDAGTACIDEVVIKDTKDFCPVGTVLNPETGECDPVVENKTLECPEGYEPNDDGTACIPVIEIKDTKCDPGYVYDEDLKQCVPVENEPLTCPTGFHLSADGLSCEPDETEKPLVCPTGFHLSADGKSCVKDTVVQPPVVVNPPVVKTTPTTYTPSTGSYVSGEETKPIYAEGMDEFDLFATLQQLLAAEPEKKDSKKSKEKTKMATGGHLDDLLAEQMTVDDLLKLLR